MTKRMSIRLTQGLFSPVPEPIIQFGKLAVIEVSPRDANAIDVAASFVESLVGQRAPKIDTNEIAT